MTQAAISATRLPRSDGRFALSIPLAAASCALVLWTAGLEHTLPDLMVACAFLLLCIESELRLGRVPDLIPYGALAIVVGQRLHLDGLEPVLVALSGALTAFALVALAACTRWERIVNAKALIVLGALWGALPIAGIAIYAVAVLVPLELLCASGPRPRAFPVTLGLALAVAAFQAWGPLW